VLNSAKQSIRQGFRDKASLPASDPSIQPAIQHAEEVASFLKANLVQGRREGSTYSELNPGVAQRYYWTGC
jgi:complex III assembly factor LYRM7